MTLAADPYFSVLIFVNRFARSSTAFADHMRRKEYVGLIRYVAVAALTIFGASLSVIVHGPPEAARKEYGETGQRDSGGLRCGLAGHEDSAKH